MTVRLRLMRVGKRNRPAYRICAIDMRRRRDGAYLENIGFYDPFVADQQKQVRLDKERAEYWLSVGASPSHTVMSFLRAGKVNGLIRNTTKPKRRRKKPETKLQARRAARAAKRQMRKDKLAAKQAAEAEAAAAAAKVAETPADAAEETSSEEP